MDEQDLILHLQAGERRALEEIIQGYTHYLTAVAARALGPSPSREDLEEVVSDAFLALWRSRDKIEPECSLRPFLAVTARNLAYSRLRGRRETAAPCTRNARRTGCRRREDAQTAGCPRGLR